MTELRPEPPPRRLGALCLGQCSVHVIRIRSHKVGGYNGSGTAHRVPLSSWRAGRVERFAREEKRRGAEVNA